MIAADPYVWIDPADAVFVTSCREALKQERAAWEACHAERLALAAENKALKEAAMAEPTLVEFKTPPGLTDFTITITNEPSAQPEPQADDPAE